jgi:outer membrane protein assembly factor BamB
MESGDSTYQVSVVGGKYVVTRSAKIDPLDWPNWRGPEQNRISRETGLIDHWDPDPKAKDNNILWVSQEAAGRCTPIVMNGKLYTVCRHLPGDKHEQEQVLCLDAATGKVLWQSLRNMYLSDVPAERVGWASVVGDPTTGRIYAFRSNCLMECLDGETGKSIWSRPLHEEFGFLSVFGGRTNFPIVFEDLVIVSAVETGWGDKSLPAHRFMALDKNTGEIRWFNSGTTERPEDTTFSTPTVAVVDGELQLIEGSSDGAVWGFEPRTGKPLWKYQMSRRGLSCSPVVDGDTIYMCQNEENLDNRTTGMVSAFSAKRASVPGESPKDLTKTNSIWKMPGKMINKSTQSSPLLVDGRLYAPDNASNFYVFDAASGKQIKKVKLMGDETVGSPLYADGKIYLCTTTGWHVFRPTAKGLDVVQQFRFDTGVDGEVLGSPIVSHGRIYVPTTDKLFCIGAADQKPAAAPIPPAATSEQAVAADEKPAQVQIVPGEVLLTTGQKQQFRVRLFNDRGQFLKESAAAEFTIAGSGQIDKEGQYQAPGDGANSATIVSAKVGNATGQARIRVVPPLPWKFDFQNVPLVANPKTKVLEGQPPVTWVGMRYRHVIRDLDGRKVMVKVNNIPKGTRSQGWMGPYDLHDYTIQADVRATTNHPENPESGLPDMGLIAQRYTMVIMGEHQELQIRYWPPQVATQFSKTVPLACKPDVWYTMKFRASTEGDKAVLKGKVWPRDEKEPEAWSIEVEDDRPNLMGSPGLAGDTTNKGAYYLDNIQVYPNADSTKTADAK